MRENTVETITETAAETSKFDRRGFFVTSIMAGFALAVQPIQAQTKITTDSNGLIAGEVKIPVADGTIPAYRAMPDAKGKTFPVVLVIQEIFGVHEWIQDVCRRFAKLGYMAIAPSLYARQGDVTKMQDINEIVSKVVSKVPDEQVMKDLDATVAYAKSSGSGDDKKLSVTGFCWGGRQTWLYAAHNPQVKAAAAWYGGVVANERSPKNSLQPTYPIDIAKDLKVPVLGLYGALDKGISIESLNQMRAALKEGKSNSEIRIYPNADHGFLADYRKSYNKAVSEDAWQRTQDWFKKHKAV